MTTAAAPGRVGWRAPAAVVVVGGLLALAAVLPARAAPAAVAPPIESAVTNAVTGAQLVLSGDGQSFLLRAGTPAYWQVGVTTRNVSLTALLASITASGGLAEGPGGASVSLALASCRVPWAGASCAGGSTPLLAATPLAELSGQQSSLADAAGIPANAYLLATVLLPQDASADAAGRSATLTIHVTASGDDVAVRPGQDHGQLNPGIGGSGGAGSDSAGSDSAGQGGTAQDGAGATAQTAWPPGSALADTGTRVGVFAGLAAAAVGAGALLAAFARRRSERSGHS